MAREPLPPLPGMPTLEPGCADTTTPVLSLVPPALLGGARTEPASPGPPRPKPFLPEPETPLLVPTDGGGGTTLLATAFPAPVTLPIRFPAAPPEPWPPTEGGGGTMLELNEVRRDAPLVVMPVASDPVTEGGGGTIFAPKEVRREIPEDPTEPVPEAEGGGGTTLVASALPVAPRVPEETAGGGGTTSCVPNSLPMTLLMNDPLLACDGGGGTIVGEEVPTLPLSRRRKSRAESAEGGGATTEGAGRLSFALRALSRSGEETGGGTTATLFICTRDGETSRLTDAGAGGITLALSDGVERAWSRETCVDAGPMTLTFNDGAAMVRSRDRLGAGAMMLVFKDGAISVCSDRTLGAGGTIAGFRAGAPRDCAEERLGAGGTTELSVSPSRDRSRVTFTGAGATTFAGRLGAVREECKPSAGSGPGFDLKASRLATAAMEEGSLRLGATTTCDASELPRATRMVW